MAKKFIIPDAKHVNSQNNRQIRANHFLLPKSQKYLVFDTFASSIWSSVFLVSPHIVIDCPFRRLFKEQFFSTVLPNWQAKGQVCSPPNMQISSLTVIMESKPPNNITDNTWTTRVMQSYDDSPTVKLNIELVSCP